MPRRNRLQREQDLGDLSALYIRGKSQAEIGEEFGISQRQVSKDLQELQRRWRESALLDFTEFKAKELARVDHLERVYWEAWERSTQERVRNVTEKVEQAGQERKRAQLEREQQTGNPAFLSGVQWCIGRRCALLGLDAPGKWEVTGKAGGPVELKQETQYDPELLAAWERFQLDFASPQPPADSA